VKNAFSVIYIYYEIVQRTDKKQLKRLGYCVHNVCIIKST